ncbi:MAG: hypothetical protein GWN01_11215 [Nitrosopumilaceae archaeon]|nr:hypothetical protein [Nitrosopumilaceae archaeon]NIU87864.1 hypothetical protein [Nitrosopumilaceae archaeon]NIX62055.1 hypothetical protein [Nitrosopumilaceae archaeon]
MKVKLSDIVGAALSWTATATIRLVATVLGLVMVPIALLFVKLPEPDATEHVLVRLPKLFDPWDNVRDGAMGDKRMWWWLKGYPKWVDKLPRKCQAFAKSFWWLAIRNSANKMSRYYRGIGCPAHLCDIEYVGTYRVDDEEYGPFGYQFVRAKGPTFTYWSFYHHIKLPQKGFFKGKGLICRIGHKVEPRHSDYDWSSVEETKAWKGWTFRPYLLQTYR